MLTLITLSTFVSIALLSALVLYPLVNRGRTVQDRLAKLMPQEEERPVLISTPGKWQTFLAGIGQRLNAKPDDLFKYREMLVAGGFKKDSLYVFLGSKLLLAAVLPAALLFLLVIPQERLGDGRALLMVAGCAIIGFLLPTFWLRRRVEHRKIEIFHMLPDVLDLLTVCVESGISLDAAFIKTVENISENRNPLIEEINQVTLEIRAGKPRMEALKGLADRTMVDDVRSFVAMLIQTEKFGTSLGKTMRTYSDSLRTKRRQQAEEAAAKTAIKMLFPLTFLIFPSLLVVLLVPAFVKFAHFFKH